MVATINHAHRWEFQETPSYKQPPSSIQRCAQQSFQNRPLQMHQRSFGCVETVPFMEAYPITSIFLAVVTGGLALIVLPFMRAEHLVDGCAYQGHIVRTKESVPFIQQYPMMTLFLTVVTGGLALLVLPFISTTRTVDRCEEHGRLARHVVKVPFIVEYPLTSLFLTCMTGGLAILPLALMSATRLVD